MLQRRIGMTWTRSGCEVSDNPRAKCLAARTLRLRSASSDIQRFSISDGLDFLGGGGGPAGGAARQPLTHCFPGRAPAAQRVEQVLARERPGELVPSERGQARRSDAAAVLAIGLHAELA